jgi:hypothetical protein
MAPLQLTVNRPWGPGYKITLGRPLLQVCPPILPEKAQAQPQWLGLVIGNAKRFLRYDPCSKNSNPPYPPFAKGGNLVRFL